MGGVIANVIAVRKTVVNPEFSQGGHFKARCAAAAAETRQRRREQHNTHHLFRGPLVKATLPVYKRFRVVFFARFFLGRGQPAKKGFSLSSSAAAHTPAAWGLGSGSKMDDDDACHALGLHCSRPHLNIKANAVLCSCLLVIWNGIF